MTRFRFVSTAFLIIATLIPFAPEAANSSPVARKHVTTTIHRHRHKSVTRVNEHPVWYAPFAGLSSSVRARADCVIYRESTSTEAHPNLGDNNGNVPGQSGIFQMNNAPGGVWDVYVLPVLHVHVWDASAYQQAQGFILVWRVDGFGPWHPYDGC